MFHTIVRGSIKLEDVVRPLLVEGLTALTFVASLTLGCGMLAVDDFGEDAGAGGLSHATRAAEQVGMSQFAAAHSILQRGDQGFLPYHGVERHRPVFTG